MWSLEGATDPRDCFEFHFPISAVALLVVTCSTSLALLLRSRRSVGSPG